MKTIKAEGSDLGRTRAGSGATQKLMEEVIWSKASHEQLAPITLAAIHGLGEIIDNWEHFAKYQIILSYSVCVN